MVGILKKVGKGDPTTELPPERKPGASKRPLQARVGKRRVDSAPLAFPEAVLRVCLNDGLPDTLPFEMFNTAINLSAGFSFPHHLNYSCLADVGIEAQLTSKSSLLSLSGCFIFPVPKFHLSCHLCKQKSHCGCDICKNPSFLPQHRVGMPQVHPHRKQQALSLAEFAFLTITQKQDEASKCQVLDIGFQGSRTPGVTWSKRMTASRPQETREVHFVE